MEPDGTVNILDTDKCYVFVLKLQRFPNHAIYYMGEKRNNIYRFINIKEPYITKTDYVLILAYSLQEACSTLLYDYASEHLSLKQFDTEEEAVIYLHGGII